MIFFLYLLLVTQYAIYFAFNFFLQLKLQLVTKLSYFPAGNLLKVRTSENITLHKSSKHQSGGSGSDYYGGIRTLPFRKFGSGFFLSYLRAGNRLKERKSKSIHKVANNRFANPYPDILLGSVYFPRDRVRFLKKLESE